MSKSDFKPVAGMVLADAETPTRIVRLVYRFNPRGKDVPPYWVVKNLVTGEETTVLERELAKRYNVPPETAAPASEPVVEPSSVGSLGAAPIVEAPVVPAEPDDETVTTGGQAPAEEQ